MKRLLAALLVVVAMCAGAPAVAAQSDNGGVLGDFLDDDEEDSRWAAVKAAATGTLNKNLWWVSNLDPLSDAEADQQKAEQDRADLQETFNANSETIANYSSTYFGGSASEWDVIAIHHVRDDGNVTQYLVADADNSTFSNASMVNTTDRTVDHEVTLEGAASDNAGAELDTFVETFAAVDNPVTREYVSRLATEYSGYIDRPEALTDD